MRQLGFVAFAVVVGGCAIFAKPGLFTKPVETLDVIRAKHANDLEFLTAVCNGEKKAAHENVQRHACELVKDRSASASTDCSTLVERFKSSPKESETDGLKMVTQFESCGKYDEFFDVAAWWSSGVSFFKLDDAKLEAAFLKYAESHTGARFLAYENEKNGGYAMRHISQWLEKNKHLNHCDAVVKAVDGASDEVRVWALPYFSAAKCKSATNIGASVLSSNNPEHRIWACKALGTFGDASAEAKLKIVATSDGFQEIREEKARSGAIYAAKYFPVREACAQAAGQVALRK